MIAKISRGSDTAGLLRYLLGPGRANEHTDPHLVASWDGDPTALEPAVVGGRLEVSALAALLDQPLDASPRRPTSTVWHCSLRNAPGDRHLSDQEWADAARHVLDRVGLAPVGDSDGCRWIVARHGEDHVHVMVTLARQDGRPPRTSNDYRRVGQACQELEGRFGLTSTRARDSTAVKRPTRPEVEKAHRGGRAETSRDVLRREVRLASMMALDAPTFLDVLHRNGLLVKTRYSSQDAGRLTGFAVAWPGDHAPGGLPVWFSGSTLAPDLSLPRLERRWDGLRDEVMQLRQSLGGGSERRMGWAPILSALARVIAIPGTAGDVARVTHAAASVLTAVARVAEGHRGGALELASTRLLNDLDRGSTGPVPDGPLERRLLAVAHLLLSGDGSMGRRLTHLAHLERLLHGLLHDVAHLPHPGSRPRHHVAVAWAVTRGADLRPDGSIRHLSEELGRPVHDTRFTAAPADRSVVGSTRGAR